MNMKRLAILSGMISLIGASPMKARADVPILNNLAASDFDNVVRDFSANFQYSSVTPASTLGGLGGFEFGLVGGIAKDPDLVNLVKTADPSSSIPSYLPHAALLGRLGLPFGLTAEAELFPSRTISSVTLKQYGGAVGWTLTDASGGILQDLPLNIMAKFSLNHAQVSYTENATVSQSYAGYSAGAVIPVGISFADTEWALQALGSIKLLVFEPYAGIGYVHSSGTLNLSTGGAIVNIVNVASLGVPPTTDSFGDSPGSFQLMAGVDIRLAFFSLGAEYLRAFGTSTYDGRISFRF